MTIQGSEPGAQPQGDEGKTEDQLWAEEVARSTGGNPAAENEITETPADPPAEPEKVETAEPTPAATPAAPTAEERMARLEQLMAQVGNDVKQFGGRVSAMQREMAQAENARKAAGDAAPTKAQVDAAKTDSKKWVQLKEDFPEWGEAIEEYVAARVPTQAPAAPAAPAVDPEAIKAQLKRELQQELIVDRYPDWQHVAKTNEFQTWFNAQPAEFRKLGESERGADVIHVFDKFNEAKTKSVADIQQNRRQKLGAAAGVGQPGRTVPPAKSESELTAEEIWNQEVARASKQRA